MLADGTQTVAALGRGRPRSRLVQARLGRHRPVAQAALEREQRDRRHVGGLRTARSSRSTATSTPTSRRSTSTPTRCRRSRRSRSSSRTTRSTSTSTRLEARGAQVPHPPPQLRQGREADVQRVPAVGSAPRRRLRSRALRRADHDPVPGVVADRHARERHAGRAPASRSPTCRRRPTRSSSRSCRRSTATQRPNW